MRKFFATAFAGTLLGMAALFAPSASAGAVHVPDRLVSAYVQCHRAPEQARTACESLWLRPKLGTFPNDFPAGKVVAKECFHNATLEAAPHSRRWNAYVTNCVRNALMTP